MSRTALLQARVLSEEKASVAAAAQKAGLNIGEYVRRELGLGKFERAAYQRIRKSPSERAQAPGNGRPAPESQPAGPTFEDRVRSAALRMPRKAAERVVRREMKREAGE